MYVEFIKGKKFNGKNADISDSHEGFQDAGYVLTDDDVVIDIDNVPRETLEKMIDTFNIKTQYVWTDRGIHLYYKRPGGYVTRPMKYLSVLSIDIEPKYIPRSKAVTIKRDGVLREIVNEGVREVLPTYFDIQIKALRNITGFSDGDGRNDALLFHRRKIEHIGEWRKIIRFINENLFDEPLSEEELMSTVLRDGLMSDGDGGGEYQQAEIFMTKYKVVRFNGTLYFRDGSRYVADNPTTKNMRRVIYQMVGNQPSRVVDEIYKQVDYRTKTIPEDTLFDIQFGNGVLRKGEFIEISDYEDFTPFVIDIDYNPQAPPVPMVDEYIDKLTGHEKEYRKLLLEILGHTLIVDRERKRSLGMFAIFVGDGGNGKGTLLEIIRSILGIGNCTALSVKDMAKESYFTTMHGKLANLGDDIHDKPIDHDEMKMLKNISTCDVIQGRELFKMSETIMPTVTLIFTSNHDIKTFEKGKAYKRRVKWLPMFSRPDTIDPHFISKLTTQEALEYWVRLVVEGYMRLYRNGIFTESKSVNEFNEKYHMMNDGAAQFLYDLADESIGRTTEDMIIGKTTKEMFEEFEVWAVDNDVEPKQKMMVNAIKEHYGLVTKMVKKNGKTRREFHPIER
jgi:putative DNA primase/helicase